MNTGVPDFNSGKTFSNWLIFPYDPKIPRGDYILVAEGEWINALKYKFEGSQIIGDRIWHNANHIISDIAYVLTEYHPERVYGAEAYELY